MKKAILLVFIFLVFSFPGMTQDFLTDAKKSFVGINLNSSFYTPFYVSAYHFNRKFLNVGLKVGTGKKNITGYFENERPYTNLGEPFYTRQSKYFYLTPGYIPRVHRRNGKLIFTSFSFPMGISKDQLTIEYSDPLFGKVTETFSESHFYQSFEFDIQYWIHLSNKINLSMGMNTGFKLRGDAPFKKQFHNLEDQYVPIVPRPLYVNVQLGLQFSK